MHKHLPIKAPHKGSQLDPDVDIPVTNVSNHAVIPNKHFLTPCDHTTVIPHAYLEVCCRPSILLHCITSLLYRMDI